MSDILKELVFLGKITDKVQFGDAIFEIGTLNSHQVYSAFKETDVITDALARTYAVKISIVARALISYNMYKFPVDENEVVDTRCLVERKKIVESFQSVLLDALFKKYEELMVKQEQMYNSQEIKKNNS